MSPKPLSPNCHRCAQDRIARTKGTPYVIHIEYIEHDKVQEHSVKVLAPV